ncbi:MAG: helix-turn-helix transcriptional regulator [Candidatus Acidiferrales bacterium]
MKNRVRFLRREKHWSQEELAARVGVSRECIEAIEKERFLPSITLAYNIAFALEHYVLAVFPAQRQPPGPSPDSSGLHPERPRAQSREAAFHSGALK